MGERKKKAAGWVEIRGWGGVGGAVGFINAQTLSPGAMVVGNHNLPPHALAVGSLPVAHPTRQVSGSARELGGLPPLPKEVGHHSLPPQTMAVGFPCCCTPHQTGVWVGARVSGPTATAPGGRWPHPTAIVCGGRYVSTVNGLTAVRHTYRRNLRR